MRDRRALSRRADESREVEEVGGGRLKACAVWVPSLIILFRFLLLRLEQQLVMYTQQLNQAGIC